MTNEKLDNARKFLGAIKEQFERNQLLRYVYGDYTNRDDQKWTQTEIVVGKRNLTAIKEPTIQAGSVDSSLVSNHYDLIVADDLVSRVTVTTKEQIDKTIQYWRDMMSLATDNAILLDIGTRWDHSDLHGWLLDQAKAHPDEYEVMISGCYEVDISKDQEGDVVRSIREPKTVVWPEAKTVDGFEQIRSQDSYDFSCLYLNDPTDAESAAFKRSWFHNKFYEPEMREKKLNTFVTYDNAPSTKAGTDFIGRIVCSVDEDNRWYLRNVKRLKVNSPGLVDDIFDMWQQYDPLEIGVEQKAFEDLIKPYIEIKSKELGIFPNVVELKDRGIRKEDRIKGRLQGRFTQDMIYFNANPIDDTNELKTELEKFPKYKYDDLADALQYQSEIAYAPSAEVKPEDQEPAQKIKRDFENASKRLQERESKEYAESI